MSYDTLFGLRERVASNLDRAVAQVIVGEERFLWEISFPLQPHMQQGPMGQPQMAVMMRDWLVLTCPSPILGEGTIVSGIQTDLREIADSEQAAVDVIRRLATNLRDAVAQKLQLEDPGPPPKLIL